MKNAKKWLGVLVIVMLVSALVVGMVACDPKKPSNNGDYYNDTTAFSMSIQTPDGVFNPFFSTSAYDSSVISMTQISMFNTDKEGNLITGSDQPTVALAFKQQPKDSEGNPTSDEIAAQNGYTDYEILIKNGIKFSDGRDLTIKDVLFNLYVYLDPVFTGSATIYSTDIVGLNAYRTQEQTDLGEAGMNSFEQQFYTGANTYLTQLVAWVNKYKGVQADKNPNAPSVWDGHAWNEKTFKYGMDQGFDTVDVTFEELANKVNHVASLYHDELVSDWNAINMEDYEKWPDFTEPWQVFVLNDMGATDILRTLDGSNTLDRTEDGTYKLNVEYAQQQYYDLIVSEAIDSMPAGPDKDNAIRDAFVKSQFETVFGEATKDSDGNYIVDVEKMGSADLFEQVVNYWGTASTLMDELVAEVKTNYFKDSGTSQGLKVPNITGITVAKVKSFTGKQSVVSGTPDVTINGEHYVLKIRINKVDPKALMNFAFTVAPMHYYSNDTQVNLVNEDWKRWEAAGAKENEFNNYVTHFGLKYADTDFMNNEINAPSKIVKPLGAGAYQASNDNGEENFYNVTGGGRGTGFYDSNMIFYTRNNYFWTVGADGTNGLSDQENSGLHNAYIKKAVYKVVAQDQIISALARGDILFGDPSATYENQDELVRAGLTVVKTKTAGYGYIGVNPRYVPDYQVRQAIMMAMDIDGTMINDYYKGGFADRITRPMSNTSWAYPWDAEPEYDFNDYKNQDGVLDAAGEERLGKDIRNLVESADYSLVGGVYQKGTQKLEIKFTIAGGSTDHPAYSCFLNAQRILNNNGFNVQVVTSAQALTDLSAGKLAVWAAAWSSAIDPDMYQVYHINSQASSTSNWGYKQIKADTEKYSYEYGIITELSEKIDAARETTDQDNRKEIYAECLDLVMDLAVELPTYNRYDLAAYNSKYIDSSSLPRHNTQNNDEVSSYYGLLSRIWDVRFV